MTAVAAHVWLLPVRHAGVPLPTAPRPAAVPVAEAERPVVVRSTVVTAPIVNAPARTELHAPRNARPATRPVPLMFKSAAAELPMGTMGAGYPIAAGRARPAPADADPSYLPAPLSALTRPALAALLRRGPPTGLPRDALPQELAAGRAPAIAIAANQQQIVMDVLDRYARAYERMDVGAAKALWPSLDDKRLRRAFAQLDGQQVQLGSCGVSITGDDANARCRGSATFRPKVGAVVRRTGTEWKFNLSRASAGWQIVDTNVQ